MTTEKNWLIFISHAGTDTWVAQRIAEKISSCGANTFLDQLHIDHGEDFEERLHEALEQADELLVLITPWSLDRPYIWVEIGAAWLRKIPIITVLYGVGSENFLMQAKVPVFMKRRDFIDLNQVDEYFEQLKNRITTNEPLKW